MWFLTFRLVVIQRNPSHRGLLQKIFPFEI